MTTAVFPFSFSLLSFSFLANSTKLWEERSDTHIKGRKVVMMIFLIPIFLIYIIYDDSFPVNHFSLFRLSGLSPPVIASDRRERGNPIQRRYKMRLLHCVRNDRRLVNG